MSHPIAVGLPYNPKRRSWPEVSQYNFRGGEHELALFFASPSRSEVQAVAAGEVELAVYVDQPAIVLLYRFGREGAGIPWSDAPYSWHLVPRHERKLPPELGGQDTLRIVLVDAGSGLVRALRLVLLPEVFTLALRAAIVDQASAPWDSEAYGKHLAGLYATFPDCAVMARAAGHLTTVAAKTVERRDA